MFDYSIFARYGPDTPLFGGSGAVFWGCKECHLYRGNEMKRVLFGAVAGALLLGAAGMTCAEDAPALGALDAYIGKYPWEKVNGVAFTEDPAVRAAVAKAAPSADVSEALLGEDMVSPIIKVDDRLFTSGWDRRSAGASNWAILAALDGSKLAVCYFGQLDSTTAYWYVNGKIVGMRIIDSGCPSEAGDLADLDTFPIGPLPVDPNVSVN